MKNSHFERKLFLLLLVLPFIILMSGIWAFAANVPIGDDYDAILNYLNYPWPERFFHLADFHNEHRIVPTRLVSELVYRFLGYIDFRAVIWIGNLGWWMFAGTFAWLFWKRGGIFRWGAVFASWMLVGFYDQENAFWAMTSIQNHWVIVFAFAACLAFSRRSDARWFAASLAFAVAATFTSGGGLLVFPAMALMAVCDSIFEGRRTMGKRSPITTIIFVLVAVATIGLMLHNLPHNNGSSQASTADPIQRVKCAIGFFFCFFGNMIPVPLPAFLAGIAVVTWGLIVSYFAPRYRKTPLAVFAFLSFCIAQILAATAFRGTIDSSAALYGRYRIITASAITSLMYLTLVELPIDKILKCHFLKSSLVACLLLSSVYAIRGVQYNSAHKTSLEAGIALWPANDTGLEYPSNKLCRVHASTILKQSLERGVYRH